MRDYAAVIWYHKLGLCFVTETDMLAAFGQLHYGGFVHAQGYY